MIEVAFPCMGSEVRLLAGPAAGREGERHLRRLLEDARDWLEHYARALSRFHPASELCALNADPRPVVPASPLLRAGVSAALWSAERSGGLVDPTLAGAMERAGYVTSRAGLTPAPLADALARAPRRRPAQAHPAASWRSIRVTERAIERPPGVRLDNGGSGKGLAADAVAHRLAGLPRFVVDCGGDVRHGGTEAERMPQAIEVVHPLTRTIAETLELGPGAIATSGLDVRVWRTPDGGHAHHLLDPATGEPAWTGLVGATAVAPTALEAETLAKAALLSGPGRGRAWLAEHGGVLFDEHGGVELVGPLAGTFSITVPAAAAGEAA
jgi:thiamine biosynthesis lipoprotein